LAVNSQLQKIKKLSRRRKIKPARTRVRAGFFYQVFLQALSGIPLGILFTPAKQPAASRLVFCLLRRDLRSAIHLRHERSGSSAANVSWQDQPADHVFYDCPPPKKIFRAAKFGSDGVSSRPSTGLEAAGQQFSNGQNHPVADRPSRPSFPPRRHAATGNPGDVSGRSFKPAGVTGRRKIVHLQT
jgi:hypothetical protein